VTQGRAAPEIPSTTPDTQEIRRLRCLRFQLMVDALGICVPQPNANDEKIEIIRDQAAECRVPKKGSDGPPRNTVFRVGVWPMRYPTGVDKDKSTQRFEGKASPTRSCTNRISAAGNALCRLIESQ
jgi:hypothetical protein